MTRVFSVRGVVVDDGGAPLPGLVIAIADADPASDDLIAVGYTGPDGGFQASFTREAFNQDLLELERVPDLYVVLSRHEEGKLRALHRADFPGLRFEAPEDLGEVRLPAGEPPAGLEALPGFKKRARRVRVDSETIGLAVAEVAPLVESLTGWRGLLEGIAIEAVDGLGAAMQGMMRAASPKEEGALDRWIAKAATGVLASAAGALAFYDPFSRRVLVDRRKAERQGLDGLKVLLGHELVHVGQFREHPELAREYAAAMAAILRANEEDNQADPALGLGPKAQEAMDTAFGLMANIEGYASHIEHDFLREVYRFATPLPHASLMDLLILRLLGVGAEKKAGAAVEATAGEVFAATVKDKMRQYEAGRAAYQARAEEGRPASFDPGLRPGGGQDAA